jgi:hypothetical protein
MFMEPIIRQEVVQAQPDTASRAAGIVLLPIALATLALWIALGCVFVAGSVSAWYVNKAFRTIIGAVDYAGMVALGR